MAVNEARIVKPLTNLYKDVTLPADNTFLTLSNGVPPSGIHCGAIGSIGVSNSLETEEKDSENQLAILGAAITSTGVEISVRLKEWTTAGIAWLTAGRRQGNGFFLGGTTELSYTSMCVVWEIADSEYAFALIYKTYVSSPANIEPEKGSFSEFESTLTAVADTTRVKSDQMGQLWFPDGFNDFE